MQRLSGTPRGHLHRGNARLRPSSHGSLRWPPQRPRKQHQTRHGNVGGTDSNLPTAAATNVPPHPRATNAIWRSTGSDIYNHGKIVGQTGHDFNTEARSGRILVPNDPPFGPSGTPSTIAHHGDDTHSGRPGPKRQYAKRCSQWGPRGRRSFLITHSPIIRGPSESGGSPRRARPEAT